jgi:hypothetical protein
MLVLVDGLASLHNLIKQDAYTLNKTSILRLKRRVQKLVDAAQVSIAKCALLYDKKQKLTRIANEAKVRRLTKSLVLGQGQGKVISFADIEEARAARAAKDDKKGKGKRGRKRKSAALEADKPKAVKAEVEPEPEAVEAEIEPEPEPEVARAAKEVVKGKKRG